MTWWHVSNSKIPPNFINMISLQLWIAELQVLTTAIYGFLSDNWGHLPQVTQLLRLCTTSMLSFTRIPRIPRSSWAPRQRLQPLPCAWCLWMTKQHKEGSVRKASSPPSGCFCFHTSLYAWKELQTNCPHALWQRRLWYDQRIWNSGWQRWNLNNYQHASGGVF